ncbi:hypothetical protein NQ314_001404 [Rhamnusium bicolor]|uniref:beta-N-acetylhexosaminidase n=1 Tax=Rhamnusium bicolor TaxID=1586634 RepID=A0AAV8ZSB6_9CUCU|nr:hypothetical protein NQ314_001404 [Rhamnusium bicolor]
MYIHYQAQINTLPICYRKSHPPQWTWECINQRCERRHIKGGSALVSLATCSMLCGSTQLWPQPTGPVTLGSRAVTFNHHQFQLESNAYAPAKFLLEKAFANFNDNVISLVENKDYVREKTDIHKFLISVTILQSGVVRLKLNTDEGYSIIVKTHGNKVLKGATVEDNPVFPYRGLMVDTSRNFMSMESLKKVLVGMSASKLNVFHWHITDSQSFPLVVPSVPQLAITGAYGSGMIYSPEEVKALVEFARLRGIRVVLEVDTPAHAGNGWTWGPQEGKTKLIKDKYVLKQNNT